MEKKEVLKKENTAVTTVEKNITDEVLNKIKALEQGGNIQFPPNYSYANALKSAWLKLQTVENKNHNKALDFCSKVSIANSLLDMVIQGLTPAKNQCYFIMYDKELRFSRSYMGTVAVTKRLKGIKDVFANVIYKDDIFKYKMNLDNGLKEITVHDQDFMNIDNSKIVGAYAVVVRDNEPNFVEIMNIAQIKASWNQGASNGQSPAHKNFAEEMAKKTVTQRACKMFFNTSDDSEILIGAINRTTESEYISIEQAEDNVKQIANSKDIDFEYEVVTEPTSVPTEAEKAKILEKEISESNGELEF